MTKKYKIEYKKNSANYFSIDHELITPYYNKIIEQIKERGNLVNILTLEEYKSNINKFNQYQRDISIYILNKGPEESKEYIKSLMGLNNIEADILYRIANFTNEYFSSIDDTHEFIKKKTEQIGGAPGKTCVTLSLLLDVGGMVPGLGMAIDALSVAVSLFCGDYFGAALGLFSIIPVAGWASGAIEIIRNGIKMYQLFNKVTHSVEEIEEKSKRRKKSSRRRRKKSRRRRSSENDDDDDDDGDDDGGDDDGGDDDGGDDDGDDDIGDDADEGESLLGDAGDVAEDFI
jgi:hypothetical protein